MGKCETEKYMYTSFKFGILKYYNLKKTFKHVAPKEIYADYFIFVAQHWFSFLITKDKFIKVTHTVFHYVLNYVYSVGLSRTIKLVKNQKPLQMLIIISR